MESAFEGRILNLDKPEGWTSFDVVRAVRHALRIRKVGHAGTLDPFATGVLLVCTGRATKQVSELMGFDKEYEAIIQLGVTTDTMDLTGKVSKTTDFREVTLEQIEPVCENFRGNITQIPPMFSAIKVKGERLYKKARRGEVIEREPRKVTVHELELKEYRAPFIAIRVVCSKGTYVRVLAHDIGEQLGCGGHLKSLVRTRIGPYEIAEARQVSELTGDIAG
jgi:tRNA pseudouridine55 synthase